MITCARPARLLHSLRLTASSASKWPRRRGGGKSFSRTPVCCAHISWSSNHPFHSSSFSEVPDGNKKSSALQFAASFFAVSLQVLQKPLSPFIFVALQPTAPLFQLLNSKAGSESHLERKNQPRLVPEAIPLPPCFSENRRYYPMKCSFG